MARKKNQLQEKTKKNNQNMDSLLEKYRQEFAAELEREPGEIRKPLIQTETNRKPSK